MFTDRRIHFTRTAAAVRRPWPLSLLSATLPPLKADGSFGDRGQWEERFAADLRRAARRRGWRATARGAWEHPGPEYDPDTRVDVIVDGATFSLIVWDAHRPAAEGWIAVEQRVDADSEPVFEMVRSVLSATPGVQILRDFAQDVRDPP